MKQLDCIMRLSNKFARLPGVGAKTAQRYAYSIIDMPCADVEDFCAALKDVKNSVRYCAECGNFTDKEVCEICARRDKSIICVVAYPKDVLALERVSGYRGVYHVLHGTLSPLEGRGPDSLKIKELLARLEGAEEVILATNTDVEGEATAMYLARLIKPMGVKVSRIAQGISIGSELEYADEVTLTRALEKRTPL
ncbi:recombination mediator RecR [Pumilibacter intestinalis]|uniref:recombination mediator RecR n=1 Tax=Pumilibacter intestinalis TaxID=2941511 RepID=UPI002041CEF6|nr:recombination mediator RecR [Pumilibacter intestinalis]